MTAVDLTRIDAHPDGMTPGLLAWLDAARIGHPVAGKWLDSEIARSASEWPQTDEFCDMSENRSETALLDVNAPELKTGGENRTDGQLGAFNAILRTLAQSDDQPSITSDSGQSPAVVTTAPESTTGDRVGEVEHPTANPKRKSKRKHRRTPQAVQKVLDYLKAHPSDVVLTTDALKDKLRIEARLRVGRSSVAKALSFARPNGQR